jgi:hypothetical protein
VFPKNVARKSTNPQPPDEPSRTTANSASHLATLSPYILVFACLLIGGSSVVLLMLSVIAAFTQYKLTSIPFFAGFALTLRMVFSLAKQIIAKSENQK